MKYKKFISNTGKISFEYSSSWKDSIEEDNTYLFYDEMLGSFRVTPLIIEGDSFNLKNHLTKEYNEHKSSNAEWKKFNNRDFVCYQQMSENKEDNTKLHFFISGDKNILLICSYTFDRSLIGDSKIKGELKEVEHSLESISFN